MEKQRETTQWTNTVIRANTFCWKILLAILTYIYFCNFYQDKLQFAHIDGPTLTKEDRGMLYNHLNKHIWQFAQFAIRTNIFGNLNIYICWFGQMHWYQTIWHQKIWYRGQFGTGQFDTRTIWHQDNLWTDNLATWKFDLRHPGNLEPDNMAPEQFGIKKIWHLDNLAPAQFDCRQNNTKKIWGQDNLVSGKFQHQDKLAPGQFGTSAIWLQIN